MTPSNWLQRFAPTTPGAALDVACGSGRNLRWLVGAGWQVTGVDRDVAATAPLQSLAKIIDADIENGPWPLRQQQFDLVVVCNYLWRPLFDTIKSSVKPSGLLIWETFADGQQTIGRPSRPDFLLQRGELLRVCHDWRIVAYEDLFEEGADIKTSPRFVQRVAAIRPPVTA
ncbi:class I SAM-dependent methyltransferase [Roseateles asaccharophilus]|uniref:SAM-dependent methyltransferase n=1 Tax=Roseateles asaccharophilus TaxID=582607 RepID=A0ABU2AA63_9BURK|nr:class I SAM-dependent methyltransferase [Roseateles asaccharophilus]MDR7334095.1 SAM-dependent methyltransferase [Roseateles asaccharophilus]